MEHRELWQFDMTDSLTGSYSRRAGKEKLREIINKAREKKEMLTVAMLDVNGLNRINNRYGDGTGDDVLRFVVYAIEKVQGQEDVCFRLSSDEFIAVFYGVKHEDAGVRMKHALDITHDSEEKRRFGLTCEVSFCYGLVDIYPEDSFTVSDIITKADELMYLQKRRHHILRAKDSLNNRKPEAKRIEEENFQYNSHFLFEALEESTDDYIFIGNMKTGTFRYPQKMAAEFGLPGEVVENAAAFWSALIHPHDEQHFLESNQEIADGRAEKHDIEYRAKNVRGEWIWLRCRGKLLLDESGQPDTFAGTISNLGKEKQIDHMTGLYNRFEFEGNVKKDLIDIDNISHLGIMILDMDGFKNVNDLYDRFFGDEILRRTGQVMASMLPENARIFRLDGDEFGVVITNGTIAGAKKIYEKLQEKYSVQQEHEGKKYFCTISAGYACYPSNGDNYLDLLKCATYALECSKNQGKNRLTVYTPEILAGKEKNLHLVELLRESVSRGFAGFSLNYQPQVDARTGELFGAEALARWQCSKYGNVPPGEFIPLLEQSGLIDQVGKWIFRQAVRQCREWCRLKPDFRMSINLSYKQFLDGNLVSYVREVLEEEQVSPSNLTLELTESYFVKEDAIVRKTLRDFQEMGSYVAMDDFGVGYSSLFMLKNIPVDIVKIDRGFVKDITTDIFNATFVRSITELCNDVGKSVCLEGVETLDEYQTVKEMGLKLIQGYYYGRPMTREMFIQKYWSES